MIHPNSPKDINDNYLILRTNSDKLERFIKIYFIENLPIYTWVDLGEGLAGHYCFNDNSLGLSNNQSGCSKANLCLERLLKHLKYDDWVQLPEENWDDYVILIFYFAAFKTYVKSFTAQYLKEHNKIRDILNLIMLLKTKNITEDGIKVKIYSKVNENGGTLLESNFDNDLILNLIEQLASNQNLSPFIKSIPELISPSTSKGYIQDIISTLVQPYENYDLAIRMRGISMLLNFIGLKQYSNNFDFTKKPTNNELRFVMETMKIVGLQYITPLEQKNLNGFLLRYKRGLKKLSKTN